MMVILTHALCPKMKIVALSPLSLSQLHKQNNEGHLDLFFTFSKLLLKASYHPFKAFNEWILTSHNESEAPSLSHCISHHIT